ncbi:hypothetical protein [Catenuloplanes atrovinosus]|uniref:hypothetical protein n=1 Tax=Catenuloplanes atrovinosus TaxID=137266 RepID=UPI00286AFA55|nr:hypothetical protein [Catenuloplanes atrovinosus]
MLHVHRLCQHDPVATPRDDLPDHVRVDRTVEVIEAKNGIHSSVEEPGAEAFHRPEVENHSVGPDFRQVDDGFRESSQSLEQPERRMVEGHHQAARTRHETCLSSACAPSHR